MKYIHSAMALFTAIVVAFAFTSAVEARDKQYVAKQVGNFVVDGNLVEWGTEDAVIILDQLKDVGNALPDPKDFSGEVMVGWNDQDAERIYFVYIITDDKLQDINDPGASWWDDDGVELIFDFKNNGTMEKWGIGAGGQLATRGCVSTEANTEYAIVTNKAKNQYIFEFAITAPLKVGPGVTIGLSPIYNDCENGAREHQIGWIGGGANNAANMGDLTFSEDVRVPASVEPSDKLATVWGALKL